MNGAMRWMKISRSKYLVIIRKYASRTIEWHDLELCQPKKYISIIRANLDYSTIWDVIKIELY